MICAGGSDDSGITGEATVVKGDWELSSDKLGDVASEGVDSIDTDRDGPNDMGGPSAIRHPGTEDKDSSDKKCLLCLDGKEGCDEETIPSNGNTSSWNTTFLLMKKVLVEISITRYHF